MKLQFTSLYQNNKNTSKMMYFQMSRRNMWIKRLLIKKKELHVNLKKNKNVNCII